eukprot:2610019-Prymnesium_polylepis.1
MLYVETSTKKPDIPGAKPGGFHPFELSVFSTPVRPPQWPVARARSQANVDAGHAAGAAEWVQP